MPGDERLRSTLKPVRLDALPEAIRDNVEAYRSYTQKDWAGSTNFTDAEKSAFLEAREKHQFERNRLALDFVQQWKDILSTEEHEEHDLMRRMFLPFFLDDDQLDLAISTFQKG